MTKKTDKKISKFLSLVLRHNPNLINIELDDNGYTDIDALIKNAQYYKKLKISWDDLRRVVAESDKQRFSISGTKIRANQGHSIKLKMEFEEKKPPSALFHGTTNEAKDLIFKSEAILPMGRHHVHLSVDKPTAWSVARRRTSKPLMMMIAAKKMYEDGYRFYISDNGVWLTEKVPVDYFYGIYFG